MISWFVLLLQENRKFIITAFIILFSSGIYAINHMQKQILPNIPIESIHITASNTNLYIEENINKIFNPLENKLKNLKNLRKFETYATNNGGTLVLSFKHGTNMQENLIQVNELVKLLGIDTQYNIKVSNIYVSAYIPAINIAITSYVSDKELSEFIEYFKKEIESVTGVLYAKEILKNTNILDLILRPEKVEQYKINPRTISITNLENDKATIGIIDKQRFQLQLDKFSSIEEIKGLPIGIIDEQIITLNDIIDNTNDYSDIEQQAINNHKKIAILPVYAMESSDIRQVINNIQTKLQSIKNPHGIEFSIITNLSREIDTVVTELSNTAISTILAIMIIIALSLGFNNGLIISAVIPISIISSFLFFFLLGKTINVLLLVGIIISTGIIIDNAILIVEEAYVNQQKGMKGADAYLAALSSVYSSIISSTITTIIAFVAITFGSRGMMTEIATVVVIILSFSMIVSLVLVPVLGIYNSIPTTQKPWILDYSFEKINQIYTRIITAICYSNKLLFITILGSFTVAILLPLFYLYVLEPNIEPHIQQDYQVMNFKVQGNDFYSVEEKAKIVEKLRTIFYQSAQNQVQELIINIAREQDINIANGIIILDELYDRSLHSSTIIEKIKESLRQNNIEQVKKINFSSDRTTSNLSTEHKIHLIAMSSDLNESTYLTQKLSDYIYQNKVGYKLNKPISSKLGNLVITLNKAILLQYGLNHQTILSYLRLLSNEGVNVGKYKSSKYTNTDIIISYPEYYQNIEQIKNLQIPTKYGMVAISKFISEIKTITRLSYVEKSQGSYITNISFENISGLHNDDLITKIKNDFKGYQILTPNEYKLLLETEEQDITAYVVNAMLIGILGMFLVLLIQFDSFYQPLAILTSVLFSITGVTIGYIITGVTPIITMTGLACILLSGIVINDNIILLSTYNKIIREINDPIRALIITGQKRLKPVLLTSATTIIGLLPSTLKLSFNFLDASIAYNSPNNQWLYSLAMPIVFGLTFDTIVTLVITPSLVLAGYKIQEAIRKYYQNSGKLLLHQKQYHDPK